VLFGFSELSVGNRRLGSEFYFAFGMIGEPGPKEGFGLEQALVRWPAQGDAMSNPRMEG
jgi:hypothetical protein